MHNELQSECEDLYSIATSDTDRDHRGRESGRGASVGRVSIAFLCICVLSEVWEECPSPLNNMALELPAPVATSTHPALIQLQASPKTGRPLYQRCLLPLAILQFQQCTTLQLDPTLLTSSIQHTCKPLSCLQDNFMYHLWPLYFWLVHLLESLQHRERQTFYATT
jgi:hypothetical protein